jgi:hypothetical protein
MNNPFLFNAAMAGVSGGANERWITDTDPMSYTPQVTAYVAFATAVDAAIPAGVITTQMALLLQSIVQGVVADRSITESADYYQSIAAAIAALYSEALNSLDPAGGPPSGGSVIHLTNTAYVNPGHPAAVKDGSIAAPFETVQDAIDAGWPRLILCTPGNYSGFTLPGGSNYFYIGTLDGQIYFSTPVNCGDNTVDFFQCYLTALNGGLGSYRVFDGVAILVNAPNGILVSKGSDVSQVTAAGVYATGGRVGASVIGPNGNLNVDGAALYDQIDVHGSTRIFNVPLITIGSATINLAGVATLDIDATSYQTLIGAGGAVNGASVFTVVGLSVPVSQTVYVDKNGRANGNGTQAAPVLTVQQALDLITDASPTKRYNILVGAGTYATNFAMKANAFIVGAGRYAVRITCPSITFDATWTPAGDHRSGMSNLVLSGGAKTFDFNTVSSIEGKLFFNEVSFSQLPTTAAFSDINQCTFVACHFFSGVRQWNCINTYIACGLQNGGTINIEGIAALACNAIFLGGGTDGGYIFTRGLSTSMEINLAGFGALPGGSISIDGAMTILASAGALPGNVTLLGGATDPRPSVSGSRAANAALASLLTQLDSEGLIVDATTI